MFVCLNLNKRELSRFYDLQIDQQSLVVVVSCSSRIVSFKKMALTSHLPLVSLILKINYMAIMEPLPQPKVPPPPPQPTAPFTPKAPPSRTHPHPSPAPTPAPRKKKATSQCRLLLIRRVRTATATEMRRERCSPKVETTLCTALLTPALSPGDRVIIIMASSFSISYSNFPLFLFLYI